MTITSWYLSACNIDWSIFT